MRPSKAGLLLLSVGIAVSDCASLEPLPADTCGNGVVDANEDCDSFPSHCGAPTDGASACRLRCGDGLPACPDGWGCSVQKFCREPAGSFAIAGGPQSTGVATMLVGDFDGDGRADVLGSGPRAADNGAKVRVHYFDDGANLASVQAFLAPFASPVVRDFDADGRADFAFGVGGIGIMLGQRDRTFSPVVFPSFKEQARLVPILVGTGTLAPPGGPSTYLYASAITKDGQTIDVLGANDPSTPNGDYAITLPAPTQAILASAWAPHLLDGATDSTCGEVVIAFDVPPVTKVAVYSPCARRATPGPNGEPRARWAPEHQVIDLELPGRAEKGILLADENHDGHVDILAGTSTAVYAAHGTGTGFGAFAAQASFEDMPLASGDLNGDGIADFVMPRGLRMSQTGGVDGGVGATAYGYLQVGRPTRWARAVVAQLNGDAYPDIIASADEQPDIDFLAGTGGGTFTSSTISTTGSVTRLATGDIDGDRITDVLFAEERAVTGENEIGVAYGRFVGPPEPPRSVGKFASVVRMDAIERALTVQRDLAIFAETPAANPADAPTVSFAILLGSGDRQPIAPLLLSDGLARQHAPESSTFLREWRVQNVAAGPLEDASRVDLAVVAIGYRFRASNLQPLPPPYPAGMWSARGRGPLEFDSPSEVVSLDPLAARLAKGEAFIMHATTADLDTPPDGVVEVVAYSQNADASGPALVIVHPGRPPSVVKVGVDDVYPTNQLAVLDVDGDARPDAVVVAGAPGKSKLLVFFNDGAAGFEPAPLEVNVPDEPPTAVAQIVTGALRGAAPRRSLVVVTAHRVFWGEAARDRSKVELRPLAAFPDGLAEGTGVAAGDFDGDGVEDLAVADKGSIRVARQLARLP